MESGIETSAFLTSLAANIAELPLHAIVKMELITTAMTVGLGILRVAREGAINTRNLKEYQKQLKIISN